MSWRFRLYIVLFGILFIFVVANGANAYVADSDGIRLVGEVPSIAPVPSDVQPPIILPPSVITPPPTPVQQERGFNLSHWPNTCDMAHGILATGVDPEPAMKLLKERGFTRLRLLIWHMDDPGAHSWGVIPTSLPEPYHSRLERYLDLTRQYNFQLEISFGPQWSNSPLEPVYHASKKEGNFALISKVHEMAPWAKFDLLNEGASHPEWQPSLHPRLSAYVREVTQRFPNGTVSAIADGRALFLPPLPWRSYHYYIGVPGGGDPNALAQLPAGEFGETFFGDDPELTGVEYDWPLKKGASANCHFNSGYEIPTS